MAKTVSDFMIRRLQHWGVKRIYGYPGDGINGIMSALHKKQEEVDFVQVRHEEMAAFMACAHAKFTGEVGVCLATSGPGAIHLLNGLYDAKMDHQPVVAIVGQQARMALGSEYQQEVDLTTLFKDVAGAYVQQASHPAQIRTLVDRAMRIAKSERTVTCIILPHDLQIKDYEEMPQEKHGSTLTGVGYDYPRVIPAEADLRRAANVLNAGKKVAMLIGAGALQATDEVMAVAELLGAGVAKALLGKTALADDLPYVTGSIGLLGTKPSWDLMNECDTLLMIGTTFPYAEFLPREGQARGVQIDIEGRNLSLRYPMEVGLHGDAAETLRALMPYLKRQEDRAWREKIENHVADWWKTMEMQAGNEADPVNPQRVFAEASPRLPANAIMTCDSGSAANWFARQIRAKRGQMASLSGNLATMGPGVPYAIAAKFAWPDRPVIAMVGDGAMQMNGMNELLTIHKYWKEWADPRLVVLVLSNRDLNQVTWEQRVMEGDPRIEISQWIPEFDFARYAEFLGLKGVRITRPEEIGHAWDVALASDRPCVIDAIVDPEVSPIPPHITFEQASKYAQSILAEGAGAVPGIRLSLLQWAEQLMPKGGK